MSDTKETAIDKLIKNQTDSTHVQFFRYIFVGGAAFIVDFVSLFIFTDVFGVYYLISAVIAFILGLIANYTLSINWVFNKRTLDNKLSEFTIFAVHWSNRDFFKCSDYLFIYRVCWTFLPSF